MGLGAPAGGEPGQLRLHQVLRPRQGRQRRCVSSPLVPYPYSRDIAEATTEEGRATAVAVLDTLATKYPRSLAVRRLALDLVSSSSFRTKASAYLTSALSKGVPSIFADLKSLYSDPEKRDIIGDLATSFLDSLSTSSTFTPPASQDDDNEEVEPSSAYLWTLYFLAQHHSALGNQPQALALLAQAEMHTPSLPELSMLKARVLKRAGDAVGALESMTEARMLDGQDRFLNSKNAKYLIRADKVEEAEKVLGLFTKVPSFFAHVEGGSSCSVECRRTRRARSRTWWRCSACGCCRRRERALCGRDGSRSRSSGTTRSLMSVSFVLGRKGGS